MNAVIRVEQVKKSYGKRIVLQDVQMMVEEGKIYGFIGPSGAGKTTLIKLIVGMDEPDQGEIMVLDKRVPNMSLFQRIGYMAQSDALYTELTGEENLRFFASLYSLGREEQKRRIAYASELVNLQDDLKKRVAVYSGGMKRRLSLAIALIQNPELLVLDEPTVGIDPELRASIWGELARLKKEEGKTIVVTTHVMDEAERCDVVGLIRGGRLIATGSPVQLKDDYQVNSLEEVFLKVGRESR